MNTTPISTAIMARPDAGATEDIEGAGGERSLKTVTL